MNNRRPSGDSPERGAYGRRPDDAKAPLYNPEAPQFGNPVHCVRQTYPGPISAPLPPAPEHDGDLCNVAYIPPR